MNADGKPPSLLVVSSTTAVVQQDSLWLDKKFVAGMLHYAKRWPGEVVALLRRGTSGQAFGALFDPQSLPFKVQVVEDFSSLKPTDLDADMVLASGDNFELLELPTIVRHPSRLVYTIEYTPETRNQIAALERGLGLRRLMSVRWLARQERRRRAAFSQAAALQANGYPAFDHYGASISDILLYLDNRIGSALLVTSSEQALRIDRLASGKPLRIIHSGRLEKMKGAQDIGVIVDWLIARGVNFHLDVFGAGTFEPALRSKAQQIPDRLTVHGVVDFASELVPYSRQHGDVFLSCHRQSDPSCTYLEAFGCGLPVVGYDNRMLARLADESGAAFTAKMGNTHQLADLIATLDGTRERLIHASRRAAVFASEHLFEVEFDRRIDHLIACADAASAANEAA